MRWLLRVLGGCLALTSPVWAATTPNSIIAPQVPKTTITTFLNADAAGTYKTVYTGGANGTKILGLWATSTDASAAHLVSVAVSSSTSSHCATPDTSAVCSPGTAVNVPVSSGYAVSVYAVTFLTTTLWPGLPTDSDGNLFLFLPDSTWTLEVTFATTITAAKKLSIAVLAADF